jgi:hypothetical protein
MAWHDQVHSCQEVEVALLAATCTRLIRVKMTCLLRVSAALVSSWAVAAGDSKLSAALKELTDLRLLSKAVSNGQPAYILHPGFQAQLRRAFCSGCAGTHVARRPRALGRKCRRCVARFELV